MTNTLIARNPLADKIFYAIFLTFLGYFLLVMFYYLMLALIGFIEGKKRKLESEEEAYSILSSSTFTLPVSVIIPARNEEEWISDSVGSILNLNYPEFEVIVVDDGSIDRTFEILDTMLKLNALDKTYIKHYRDGWVRGIFKSDKYPNVTVISKQAGFKKAGAINAALNLAKYKYICVMDSDTVLEPDALLKVMAHVAKDPDRIIGIGSYYGLSNGFNIKDGRIRERSFSYQPLIAYQNLEYIRSFIGNRIAWSKFNSSPIIPGGFALWRRDVLFELGGFDKEFSSEDLEFTFRVHDYMVKNGKKGYRVLMLPYFVGWTEGPSNLKSLILQRNRWQRVVEEAVWKYKYMAFNPKYGSFAFLVFPYYILYEVFGVFFEIISIVTAVIGWTIGIVEVKMFFAFLLFVTLSQILVSLLSIFAFLRTQQRLLKLRYLLYLVVLSFLEFFWYRWIISFAKISGTYSYSQKLRAHDQYTRPKRIVVERADKRKL